MGSLLWDLDTRSPGVVIMSPEFPYYPCTGDTQQFPLKLRKRWMCLQVKQMDGLLDDGSPFMSHLHQEEDDFHPKKGLVLSLTSQFPIEKSQNPWPLKQMRLIDRLSASGWWTDSSTWQKWTLSILLTPGIHDLLFRVFSFPSFGLPSASQWPGVSLDLWHFSVMSVCRHSALLTFYHSLSTGPNKRERVS